MRRLLSALFAGAALLAFASPASAFNTGTEGGGPPALSGSEQGAIVIHCNAFGVPGAIVENKEGVHGKDCERR